MNNNNYDVIVIGGGPGGYVAAIRCAQLGLTTACVESRLDDSGAPVLGGTCLNVGCIPSKALLDSSHHYMFLKHEAATHGINTGGATVDIYKMMERKNTIVQTLTQGIAGLLKKNKVEWLQGHGQLLGDKQVSVIPEGDNPYTINGQHIIIATGSVPAQIAPAPVDQNLILDSTGALALTEVPTKLGIIGAGVIGLELGSVWGRLGSEVIILEAMDEFLAPVDRQIATEAEKTLRKQGLDIRLGAKVTGTGSNNREVTVTYEDQEGKQQLTVHKLIVAVGRKPNTDGLGATAVGLELDANGFIEVNALCQTNLPDVYAIGDVVTGPMLAHKASEEGVAVAERIADKGAHLNYDAIPWVIYTWPEIAWAGKTEQELKSSGIKYKAGVFPFLASGRARALGDTTGMVKMLSDAATDKLLGIHIFGPNASELIAEAVMALEFDASTEDLARTIHAHPTLAEATHEAALIADGRGLHF
ncbi:MAG: dihydrolipoyl dehydrogenase [Gammaproteobacteria bacterium]